MITCLSGKLGIVDEQDLLFSGSPPSGSKLQSANAKGSNTARVMRVSSAI